MEEETLYYVVVNHEQQYSVWPNYKEIPLGWKTDSLPQTKEACLDYIERVWVDMRPLSLRKALKEE